MRLETFQRGGKWKRKENDVENREEKVTKAV
jgi:hypothetical protein